MCGIAGIIAPNASKYRQPLQQMTDAIAHRGPDSAAHEFFENAALGHRRLAIVDLSDLGKQPMFSATSNECVVFNGEIYGYLDLKKKYSDYPYKGTSDTELILAMYAKQGSAMVNHLPGMFAFAVWDQGRQELFCARDRFGEKPFYYALGSQREFIFASEIKAILATGLVAPEIDRAQIAYYLKNGYIHPHRTIYKNIFQLQPAHTLRYATGKITVDRYWKLPPENEQLTLENSLEKFKFLLENAVQKQLIADVPVGAFLSGGLDSSTIVAVASKFQKNIRTLCYGYETGDLNEMPYARAIAKKYNTDHIEILDREQSIFDTLMEVYSYMDEPLMDSSLLPMHLIFKEASKNLKVVLSGDVGDELFGGYSFYKYNIDLSEKGYYPKYLSNLILLTSRFRDVGTERLNRAGFSDAFDFHQNKVRNYFTKKEIQELGIQEIVPEQEFSFITNPGNYNTLMRTDLEKYVPGNMLLKGDRTAMAHSVEARIPFLDVDFAEFCISLPAQLKVTRTEDKIILRKAYAQAWTADIAKRGKNGFAASVSEWFREEKLKQLSKDLLENSNSKIFEFLDFDKVQSKLDHGLKHWSLLILALWFEKRAFVK